MLLTLQLPVATAQDVMLDRRCGPASCSFEVTGACPAAVYACARSLLRVCRHCSPLQLCLRGAVSDSCQNLVGRRILQPASIDRQHLHIFQQ